MEAKGTGAETVSDDDGVVLDVDEENGVEEAAEASVVAVFVAVDVAPESDSEPDIDPDKPLELLTTISEELGKDEVLPTRLTPPELSPAPPPPVALEAPAIEDADGDGTGWSSDPE